MTVDADYRHIDFVMSDVHYLDSLACGILVNACMSNNRPWPKRNMRFVRECVATVLDLNISHQESYSPTQTANNMLRELDI